MRKSPTARSGSLFSLSPNSLHLRKRCNFSLSREDLRFRKPALPLAAVRRRPTDDIKASIGPRTPNRQENLLFGGIHSTRTPKSSDEKPRTASIGPTMHIALKERVNEIAPISRKGTYKQRAPTIAAKIYTSEIQKDYSLKPSRNDDLKSDSDGYMRQECDPNSLLLSQPTPSRDRDTPSMTSGKDNRETQSNPSFKAGRETEKIDPDCQFSAEDEKVYGRRGMPGYEKIRLLGKGGQGLVWLARRKSDNLMVALKQIALGGFVTEKVAKKELNIDELIFQKNEGDDELDLIGRKSLIFIIDHLQTPKDMFIVLELGGQCLSKQVYSMKGEFQKSERIYKITNGSFFYEIRNNFKVFRKVITQMLLGLHTFNKRGLVHCDLKPENILINFNPEKPQDTSVKLIDFGAAFEFDGSPFLSVTTPEYLPPEFLQLFSNKRSSSNRQKHEQLVKNTYVWSIDVWSVGVIIIEMLVGVPVWMSFKCRTTSFDRDQTLIGLFSSTSRDPEKIAEKMIKFVPNMKKRLMELIGELPHFDLIVDLLEKMLHLNPKKRYSPLELLSHELFSI